MINISIIDSDKNELIILTECENINTICKEVINTLKKIEDKNIKVYKSNNECLTELISYLKA